MRRQRPRPSTAVAPKRDGEERAGLGWAAWGVVGVAFGTWLVLGAFLDGWAHTSLRVETLLTPRHAVLYSGFLATAGHTLWSYGGAAGRPAAGRIRFLPHGLALAGVVVFGVGTAADQACAGVKPNAVCSEPRASDGSSGGTSCRMPAPPAVTPCSDFVPHGEARDAP